MKCLGIFRKTELLLQLNEAMDHAENLKQALSLQQQLVMDFCAEGDEVNNRKFVNLLLAKNR